MGAPAPMALAGDMMRCQINLCGAEAMMAVCLHGTRADVVKHWVSLPKENPP
jgi:hypothetical protein